MTAIKLQSTRIIVDKIASYWPGPGGYRSGKIHLTLVGEKNDDPAWIFEDPEGRAIELLDRLFELKEPRQ